MPSPRVRLNVGCTSILTRTRETGGAGGAGTAAAKLGEAVTIEGIVTAFMPGMRGFFVQEEAADQDTNSATSEGLFVYYNTTNPGVSAANVGDTESIAAKNELVKKYVKLLAMLSWLSG